MNDTYSSADWNFEYYIGSAWSLLGLNTDYTLSGLSSGQNVFVRVSPQGASNVNSNHEYTLALLNGDHVVDDLTNVDVQGEGQPAFTMTTGTILGRCVLGSLSTM